MIEGVFGSYWQDWKEKQRITFHKNQEIINIPDDKFGDWVYSICLEVFPMTITGMPIFCKENIWGIN